MQSLFYPTRAAAWYIPGPLRLVMTVIAVIAAIQFIIWGKAVLVNGIKATARENANTEIACDICGRAVTEYWTVDIQPTGRHKTGLWSAVSAALADADADQSDASDPPRRYEFCPECYQEFKVFFHKSKS